MIADIIENVYWFFKNLIDRYLDPIKCAIKHDYFLSHGFGGYPEEVCRRCRFNKTQYERSLR